MKRLGIIALVLLALTSACVSETTYGPCVGLNGGEDSTLVYQGSTRNIVMAVVFSEMVIPPVVVALKEYKCPVARKGPPVDRPRPGRQRSQREKAS